MKQVTVCLGKLLYAKECENLHKMDKFLGKYNLPKFNEEEAESLNRPITPDEIETVIKKLPTEKSPGPEDCTGQFCEFQCITGRANLHTPHTISKMEDSQNCFLKPT